MFLKKISNRGFSLFSIIIMIAIVGAIVLGIYFYLQKSKEDKFLDWSVYQSENYNYKIKYPKNWEIVEYFKDASISEQEIIENTPIKVLESPGGAVEVDYVVIQSYSYGVKCGPVTLDECSGEMVPSGIILEISTLYTLNSLDDYIDNKNDLFGKNGYTKMSLGNIEAFKMNEAEIEGFELFEEYILEHNGRIIELRPYIYIESDIVDKNRTLNELSDLIKEIFSTLEFLD